MQKRERKNTKRKGTLVQKKLLNFFLEKIQILRTFLKSPKIVIYVKISLNNYIM